MESGIAEYTRTTKETEIRLRLNLNGSGAVSIETGFGFADHMLTLIAFWAGFDLDISCKGDIEVDAHHSLEDVGLCLGKALNDALGDKAGIARVGRASVPMDEAMCDVALDISGRPYLVFMGDDLLPPVIAGEEKDLWREFFKSFAFSGKMNLHMRFLYGTNGHHLLESACKGLGIALRKAVTVNPDRAGGVLSTKGKLDT